MRTWLAVARAAQLPVAVLALAAIVVACRVIGDVETYVPGIPSVLALVYFAPFALCGAVGGLWRSSYGAFEQAGVRRPATLRAWRAGISCLLALPGAWLIGWDQGAPPELMLLTLGCLASGLLTACVTPQLWWMLPLCLNYGYYAARVSLAGSTTALPLALVLVTLAATAFVVVPRRG